MRLLYAILFITFLSIGEFSTLSQLVGDENIEFQEQSTEDKSEKDSEENNTEEMKLKQIRSMSDLFTLFSLDFTLTKAYSLFSLNSQFLAEIQDPPPKFS